MIAFQCFDDTSIKFLSNYLPGESAKALPNLRFRQAVVVGKAVAGSVPLIVEIPEIDEALGDGENEGLEEAAANE